MQATQHIEGYDRFEQIAIGGMATVYRARQISLNKTVAVKVLLPQLAQDRSFVERFKIEARTAAKVQHENIVNVIDCGESDGANFIVMEYYDGATLEELLETQPMIPLDVAFAVLLAVCQGLEAAHTANLVHRDIKPANIIFTRKGRIKIADFGLAKAVDQMKLVTRANQIVGTPAYMSPEQTRGEQVTTQSDIFSLGVVAYELLCRRRPFDGRSYPEIVDNIQSASPDPISIYNPLVEAPMAEIVMKMLGKELWTRYKHVSEVVMDLEEAMDKYRYRRDPKRLAEYFGDPTRYMERYRTELLERLVQSGAPKGEKSRDAQVTFYRRLLYLNPTDKKARAELDRLGMTETTVEEAAEPRSQTDDHGVGADPDAEYKVILESIDPGMETSASFALKFSLRSRTPLPRVTSVVKNMPAVVRGHMNLQKAQKLVRVIESMGGVARLEKHVDTQPRSVPEAPPPETQESSSSQTTTVVHSPIEPRREGDLARPPQSCPKCGWEIDSDARFCPVCDYKFNKTDRVDLGALQSTAVFENPLADDDRKEVLAIDYIKKAAELPNSIKYGAAVAIVVLLLLILFGR